MAPECITVGDSNPDIAGIGIVIAFAAQAGLSIVLSTWAFLVALRICKDRRRQRAERQHDETPISSIANSRIDRILQLRKIENILAIISDVQSFNGISLLVAALSQHRKLDLYHYHIVYDTVNFTGISYSASLLLLWIPQPPLKSNQKESPRSITSNVISVMRIIFAGVFSVLYLTFAVLFGIALGTWNKDISGRCYYTTYIARSNASHPYVDRIYLGITCFSMFATLITCYLFSQSGSSFLHDQLYKSKYAPRISLFGSFWFGSFIWLMRGSVILIALGQYPLHLYMVIAIRVPNQSFLEGDSENTWGFGQVVALVLLIPILKECVFGFIEYKEMRKELAKEHGNEEVDHSVQENRHGR